MIAIPIAGGATRYATAGANRTSRADHTRPAAPTYATHPAAAASRADRSASGTTHIPAICATAISGIAKKFNASPANVTRENTYALTGNNITSAASDATNIGRIA